jgi:uncharacterized protein YraI
MPFRLAASIAFLALLGPAAGTARAQAHSECWYLYKSGYNVRGVQPSPAQIFSAMKNLSRTYNVPIEVIAAVCQLESGWKQYAPDGVVIHNRSSCVNLYRNASSHPNPPDVGLMQLAGATARAYDVQRLIADYTYNLEAGVKILDGKWKGFYQYYYGPMFWPGRPMDHDRMVLENWWYPLKMYNGWANLTDFTYVEIIYRHMASPVAAADFLPGVRVTRPYEAIPSYTLPPAPGKNETYFKAWSPGNRFMDGNYANYYKSTHRGTYGENAITLIAPAAMRCTTATLNVRGGPGTDAAIVGTISSGMTYAANATSGSWHRIWFNGTYGWCHGSYLTRVTGVTGVRVTAGDLNVRSGPGTAYSVLGKVHSPEIYIQTGAATGWTKYNWSGRSGWSSNAYLSPVAF